MRLSERFDVERFGLRRFPYVTAVVFAVTAVMNLAQIAIPSLLHDLERTPAGLHAEWWSTDTSLFVQDGGVFGTASNLVFLVVIGAAAEQALARATWLFCYFGAGVACEFIGYVWQPVGGGNSIAICGLTGACALALFRSDERLPKWTPQALVIWCGVLGSTADSGSTILTVVSMLAAMGAALLIGVGMDKGIPVGAPVALAVLDTGIGLLGAHNIHGAALVVGVALAVLAAVALGQRPLSQIAALH
jgi:membrane associated rhomboid family serine protease